MCPPPAARGGSYTRATDIVPDFIPSDHVSQAAYAHAADHLDPFILNHSLRVYLYAKSLGERESSDWISPSDDRLALLFTACIMHDIGTTEKYDTGPTRFEIEGADAASHFLLSNKEWNVSEKDAHEVWVAIALHSTPQISDRISILSRLVRSGVAIDFKRYASKSGEDESISASEVDRVEGLLSRGEIETVLGDAVVAQARKRPEKAPGACWPGGLYRAWLEDKGWEGVNKAF